MASTSPKTALLPYVAPKVDVERIDSEIDAVSAKTGVTASLMKKIVFLESGYNPIAKGDTKFVCPKTGSISPSYGLVQISTCYFPEVSYEQATDEIFAINFLAQHLLRGGCHLWSTCRKPAQGG